VYLIMADFSERRKRHFKHQPSTWTNEIGVQPLVGSKVRQRMAQPYDETNASSRGMAPCHER
jgi:hypothetical protein